MLGGQSSHQKKTAMMLSSSLFLLCSSSIVLAGVAPVQPVITPAPTIENVDLRQRQDSMDLASLAEVLLTGVPKSVLALALTNVPAVSRLLWSEFLDDNTPSWFTALPTDVQAYLSGEFGPTTAASNSASATSSPTTSSSAASSTSPAASAAAVSDTSDTHSGGLPLWAKILIGVLVPLFVLGLIALLVLCCLRRRRRQRRSHRPRSRTPTPAFISTTHRNGPANPPGEQNAPLRGGGYLSRGAEADYEYSGSSHHLSSSSEEYRTPIGGPSYDNIPPPTATNTQNLRRSSRHSSRHSSSSLHSVPEMPEPMHNHHQGSLPIPLPPRSPHRSRDFSQETAFGGGHLPKHNSISPVQPSYRINDKYGAQPSPYYNQGIYAGGHNPYPNLHHASDEGRHSYDNPFSDPSSPHHSGYAHNSAGSGVPGRDPELFLNNHAAQQDHESNWPLPASGEDSHRARGRSKSYDRYYEKEQVYEM
ncbi:hypothetical protein K458DRAFT_484052 [Lentithecium fluviatile CBS 122367]|uniref:Uncharacterized protein n=1 Tax=Lentithecium fluviatile CBS 122367 TaxID=1168545 RepID=A0A6G1JGL4_9PLEO|nr:hypothetical protein K458DRAFT_484052 [Lentithecium fluviatile CBS 122367]